MISLNKIRCLLIILYPLISYGIVLGYDDKITHPNITEKAVDRPEFENYLINILGLEGGLKTTFSLTSNDGLVTPKEALTNTRYPGGTDFYAHNILRLLKDGSYSEDSPLCRASNVNNSPFRRTEK